MLRRMACSGRFRRHEYSVAFDGDAVGAFDGPQSGGDSCFAGGDGLAVAAAVGAFGQGLTELLDLAEVGFSLVGVGGDGEHGRVGGVSRMRVTVWVSGARWARAVI